MTKNERIKQSIQETRLKRESQTCKVFGVKFDKSHLSKTKVHYLNMLFVEAKWIYNYQLSLDDIFSYSYKNKQIEVLNKNKQKEQRKIVYLSSQMRQILVERTKQNIINLSKAKKSNNKVGRLKFKSQVNSIPLSQFNATHKIINNKYIKLQGFKGSFKVMGLDQISNDAEFANAVLMKKNNNFYLNLTCFLPKQEKEKTGQQIGLDFGIKDSVVDSNGNKYNFQFSETKAIKKASRKFAKKRRGSKNRYKQKQILLIQYEKLDNKKKDTKNKFVSKLIKENDLICIQNEMVHQWHKSKMRGFSRKIQYGVIGGIISGLKQHPETLIIPRAFPSTQLCPACGSLNKISLEQRMYFCPCGYVEDRDIHSAKNMLIEGLKISEGIRNAMLVEKASDLEETPVSNKQSLMKQEA